MSSPYGHSLIGLGLLNLCYPRWFASRGKTFLLYGLVVLGACLPDLDFLPGIFSENPGRFHHGPFHSLGLAVGLSLMTGLFMIIIQWKRRTNLLKIQGSRFKVQGKTENHPSYSGSHYEPSNAGTHNPYRYLNITGFVFVLVFSHLLLDFFTEDLKDPYGFPLFWPLSRAYVISPWPFLPYVMRDLTNPVFWGQNLRLFIVESLFFLPFFFLSWRLKGRGRQG
jgi:inner membrane protein